MSVIQELHAFIEKINQQPEHIQNEKDRVFQFNLQPSGTYQLVLESGKLHVVEGIVHEAGVVLSLSDEHFSKLLKDEFNPMMAFMTGSLKVDGNIGLALKLQEIVKNYQ